jgi:hypothetical protein
MRRQEADGFLGFCWEDKMSCSSVGLERRHRTCRASARCLVRITTMEEQCNENNPPMSISTVSCIGASQPIPRPTSTASHLMEPCGTAGPPRSAYCTCQTRGLPRNNGTTGEAGRVIWRSGRGLRVRGVDRNLGQSPIERLAGAHWSLVVALWMDGVSLPWTQIWQIWHKRQMTKLKRGRDREWIPKQPHPPGTNCTQYAVFQWFQGGKQ